MLFFLCSPVPNDPQYQSMAWGLGIAGLKDEDRIGLEFSRDG